MTFAEAEALADRRQFKAAWALVDSLALADRMSPRGLRIRLLCCAGLARWDLGNEVAGLLASGESLDREAAARFYHLLAVAHLQDGDLSEARSVADKAVDAWKLIRGELLDDNRLAGLF